MTEARKPTQEERIAALEERVHMVELQTAALDASRQRSAGPLAYLRGILSHDQRLSAAKQEAERVARKLSYTTFLQHGHSR